VRTELVTTLKRKATKIIAALGRERQPVLITQHGLPAAYLVDVETYTALNSRLAILEGIARGEGAVEEGRVLSERKARKRMARWLS
jgi:prevent-host-death family protein